jgi:hypothetical protein
MLEGNRSISAREHRFFFGVMLLPLVLRVIEISWALVFPEPRRDGISYVIYSIFDMWELVSPLYCFTIFLVLASAFWKQSTPRLILALLPLVWLVYFFDRWFVDTRWRITLASEINPDYPFKPLDFILLSGSVIDVVSLAIVNVLFIWTITMIVRLWREPESVTDLS